MMKKSILVSSILALLVVTGCTGKDATPVAKAVEKKVEKKVEAKVEKKVEAKVVEALGAPTVAESSILSVAPVAAVVTPVATKAIKASVASDATSVVVDKVVEFADDKTGGIASKVIETVK